MENQITKQSVLVEGAAFDPDQSVTRLALFEEDGTPITSVASTPTGAQVVLTGYVVGTPDPVAATDTVNQAVGKLQAQVSAPVFQAVTIGTAIGTAAKTTTSDEPAANTLVILKFTNGNSAASPTVAFNGGAARDILLAGVAPSAPEATIGANGVGMFWFDGTNLHQVGVLS